jgi:sensor histidine kinase YesM
MIKSIAITLLGAFCGCLVYLFLNYGGGDFSADSYRYYSLFSLMGALSAWGVLMINRKCNIWFSWRKGMLTRLVIGYFLQVVFMTGVSLMLFYVVTELIEAGGLDTVVAISLLIKLCIIVVLGLVIYNVIYFAYYSYNEYAVVQIETVANERRQLQLQLEALKSQLKPHYLFNSLNTISSLLYKDAALTEKFIRRLAETYQYILSTQKQQYVSLEEEIDFVKSYHFLLKVRFEENIYLEINIPPTLLKTKMPPLTMQILVENAIKHNVVTKEKPLYIYISAIDNTVLKVINTKTDSPIHTTSFNIGLKNIKKRYDMLSTKEVRIIDKSKFEVHLPVIHQQQLIA